jgi:hypothetical protein
MSGCRLCGFPDALACLMLRRHEWIEWLAVLVVMEEARRVKEQA